MKFWAIRRGLHLEPGDPDSLDEFERLPTHKLLQVEVTQPRNANLHRLYFALCARIAKGIGETTEFIDRAFRIETGHVDIFEYGGKTYLVVRSIAFHNFDNIAFKEFWERCLIVMYNRWRIDPASVADLIVPEEVQARK